MSAPVTDKDRNLKAALAYRRIGLSVVPTNKEKKTIVKWEEFQKRLPTEDEIKGWWTRWPNANVTIICGEVSGIMVIDVDEQTGLDALNEFLPDSFQCPIATTPDKGWHYYFKYRPGLSTGVRPITGCDLRTDGGYVVAAPSYGDYYKGGRHIKGSWAWAPGAKITDIQPAEMPEEIFRILEQASGNGGRSPSGLDAVPLRNGDSMCISLKSKDHANTNCYAEQTVTKRNITFNEGGRDDSIFHLVWHLRKGGMSLEEIEIYAKFIGDHCNPPFPRDEISEKVKSAFERKKRSETGLTDDIKEFLSVTNGNISVTDVYQTITNRNKTADRATIRAILHRMAREKIIIERVGNKDGVYRKIETDCEVIDFLNADYRPVDVKFPLGLNELVSIMPGNIIIVAGVSNMGKTAFLLDIIANNMKKFDVWYFNSEMDGPELNKRLRSYRSVESIRDWKFNSRSVVPNMQDVIAKGKGKINIIDYLEVHEDFYRMGGMIKAIHDSLDGAIAFLALQKNPGAAIGRGGWGTIDKARLALNIEKGTCEIVKAKNWNSSMNPNGRKMQFELVDGWDLCGVGPWRRDGE